MKYPRSTGVTVNENGKVMIEIPKGQDPDPLSDIAVLCEGICLLTRIADKQGLRKDHETLKLCIDHLKKGFIDESYKVKARRRNES